MDQYRSSHQHQRSGNDADLSKHPDVMRLARAVTFAGELNQKLRKEFAPLFGMTNPAIKVRSRPFLDRIAQLEEAIAHCSKLLKERSKIDLKQVEQDLKCLFEAARGLDAIGNELRSDPQIQRLFEVKIGDSAASLKSTRKAAITTPLDPTTLFETGKKTLRNIYHAVVSPPQASAPSLPAQPNPKAMQAKKIRSDLAAILERDQALMDYVSPRLQIVRWAVQAFRSFPSQTPRLTMALQLPARLKEQKVPENDRKSVMAIVDVLGRQPEAIKLCIVSLTHFDTALRVLAEIRLFLEASAGVDEEQVVIMGAGLNIKQLNGSTYQLWHLHLTFDGYPPLSILFPPSAGP